MADWLTVSVLAQAIGTLGMIGGMTWALFPGRIGMLAAQLVTNLLFSAHYWLIDAKTASLMNMLSVLQAGAAIPLGENPKFRYVYLAILPIIAVGLVVTWHGGASIFAAMATALVSTARYQTRVISFRIVMVVALPCWFGHNFWVQSYPGMVADISGMIINGVMLYRLIASPAIAMERA